MDEDMMCMMRSQCFVFIQIFCAVCAVYFKAIAAHNKNCKTKYVAYYLYAHQGSVNVASKAPPMVSFLCTFVVMSHMTCMRFHLCCSVPLTQQHFT